MGDSLEPPSEPSLADLNEDSLLADLFPHFAGAERDVVGPGDDAAVVAIGGGRVVATTDAMVRNQDWRDEWSTPTDVAVKCVTQNLADVAAMGARPTSLLVVLAADPATPVAWVIAFAAALGSEAASAGVSVVGGDLSAAGPGTVLVAVTALGDLEGRQPVTRDGARPGDVVALAGSLGRAGAGFSLLQRFGAGAADRSDLERDLVRAHVAPRAPIDQGVVAADQGATAMVDLSDGLLRDAHRVARASGIRIELDRSALAPSVQAVVPVVGEATAWECVLAGGEEHSLLATFRADPPTGWVRLGVVTEGDGVWLDGEPTTPRGWDHFGG